MRNAALVSLLVLVACAGTRPAPEDLPDKPAAAPVALGPTRSGSVSPGGKSSFNAKVWVSWQDAAADCEASARAMRDSSADEAWLALKACIELGRFNRGPFVQLNLLTTYWDDELRARPDAVRIVARVIANRGGDVDGDISRVQAIRMPVFTLKAALSQPDVYKGRYVIIRGKLTDVKIEAKSATAMLDEISMKAADMMRIGQDARFIATRNNVFKVNDEHRFAENVMNPTGRKVLAKLPEADPFLEPDKEFVFVGRFDGAKPSNDDQKVGLLNIFGYYRPAALVVQ
jgi:hypothetical protein